MINTIGYYYSKNRWAFLGINIELGRYLRRLFELDSWGVQKIQPPSNGYHITIASKYDNPTLPFIVSRKKFNIQIEIKPYTNGNAYWMPVYSKEVEEFRLENGLNRLPQVPLHYCVGYLYQGVLDESDRQNGVRIV